MSNNNSEAGCLIYILFIILSVSTCMDGTNLCRRMDAVETQIEDM